MRTLKAIEIAPPWSRRTATRPFFAALDRGDTLLMPASLMTVGDVAERLVFIARKVGALVIIDESFTTIATRERVDA